MKTGNRYFAVAAQFRLNLDAGDIHLSAVALNDYNAGIGDKVALPVFVQVIADSNAFRNLHILVENGAPDAGVTPDVAVVEKNRIFHHCIGMNANTAANNRVFHHAAGDNAAS